MFKAEIAEFKKFPKTASDPHERKTPQVAEIWLAVNAHLMQLQLCRQAPVWFFVHLQTNVQVCGVGKTE